MNVSFVQARNYTRGRIKRIRVIVIHDMEAPEKPTTAEAVAAWFAGSNAPRASTHYCVDNNSVVQCVRDGDTAWGAPGANADGLQIELAGYASQTRSGWTDDYSRQELATAAKLVAALCRTYAIPVTHLTPAQVASGTPRGLCGHVDVTNAFRTPGGHTDPGPAFPWDAFLTMVQAERDALGGAPWPAARLAAAAAAIGLAAAVFGFVSHATSTPAPRPLPTVSPAPVHTTVKPTPKPTPKPPVKPAYYRIRRGDTLYGIGHRYGVTVQWLRTINHLRSSVIYPGDTLRVK